MKKGLIISVILLLMIGILFSCTKVDTDNGDAKTEQPSEPTTTSVTITEAEMIERYEAAQKWAEENLGEPLPDPEADEIERTATSFLTVGDTTYVSFRTLKRYFDENGEPLVTTLYLQLEKVENGTETMLSDEFSQVELLSFISDESNLLLYYIASNPMFYWGSHVKFEVTYKSGNIEEIDYTYTGKDLQQVDGFDGTLIYKLQETEIESLVVYKLSTSGEKIYETYTADIADDYTVNGFYKSDGTFEEILH